MRSLVVICVLSLLLLPVVGGAETILWIPAAASNPGLQGTQWTTDLWLHSEVTDLDIEVAAAFLPDQAGTAEPVEVTIQVPPDRVVEVCDAVATLFGESRPGAIRLTSDYPFYAQSRTVNIGGETGTYGQGIPGTAPIPDFGANANSCELVGAANRPGADGVRTNIGIVNTDGNDLHDLRLTVVDVSTGDPIGWADVNLGPYGWMQTDLFELLGAADRTVDSAHVEVGFSSHFLTYVSRVDNRSGDGTYLPGVCEEVYSVEPKVVDVELVLTLEGNAVVDALIYENPEGEMVRVPSPQSGYTTGTIEYTTPLVYAIPRQFCYTVIGNAPNGSVKVEVYRGTAYGYSTQGNSVVYMSDCKELD